MSEKVKDFLSVNWFSLLALVGLVCTVWVGQNRQDWEIAQLRKDTDQVTAQARDTEGKQAEMKGRLDVMDSKLDRLLKSMDRIEGRLGQP